MRLLQLDCHYMKQSRSPLPSSVMCWMLHEIFLQPRAEKKLRKLQKKAKARYEIIMRRLDELAKDPESESIPLQDSFFYGLRRMKAGVDRVILQICEECRHTPLVKKMRQCVDCDEIPESGIKIFDILHRRLSYKKSRR